MNARVRANLRRPLAEQLCMGYGALCLMAAIFPEAFGGPRALGGQGFVHAVARGRAELGRILHAEPLQPNWNYRRRRRRR